MLLNTMFVCSTAIMLINFRIYLIENMLICLWIWYWWEILGMSRNQNVKIQSNGIFHRQFKIFFFQKSILILPYNCEILVLLFPAKHANLSHGLMPCYILGIFSVFTCKKLFGAKILCFFWGWFFKSHQGWTQKQYV